MPDKETPDLLGAEPKQAQPFEMVRDVLRDPIVAHTLETFEGRITRIAVAVEGDEEDREEKTKPTRWFRPTS